VLGFREKLNKDPELVRLISTRFVPVAVDHEIERRKDAEGELYRKAAGGFGEGRGYNTTCSQPLRASVAELEFGLTKHGGYCFGAG
jgi:hypothetical protein